MHRRLLALALTTAGAVAVSAPAAEAAIDTTLTFPAGTVRVVDPSPASANEVRFTIPNTPTTRAFVDIRGRGEAHIALGSPEALGVPHAVYTTQSTSGCQVYTGTTFGEADLRVTAAGLEFDVRKDELAPEIGVALEDSAGRAPNCGGFDGSPGRPIAFDPASTVTGLQWQQPGDATGLVAISGPRAITLAWQPPADALGVRYEVYERNADGSETVVTQATGSSTTIQSLTPGVAHTYRIRAFRFWGGQWFSPSFTAAVTGVASELPPPAAAPGGTADGTAGTVLKRGVGSKNGGAAKKPAARPATPRAWKAKATRGRVLISLPKLAKGHRVEILRATKAKYGRIATTTRRSYVDRKVKRATTYRYRLVLVAAGGARSLPSKPITVRVPRG
ncbi:MAG: hypothetical protein QOH72_2294 [Solirubrobacteraceae bacterium]|nr:hypothetical protein [Solirubrobacteraceae bacterium]